MYGALRIACLYCAISLPPLCELQQWNSGCQVWMQVHLPAEFSLTLKRHFLNDCAFQPLLIILAHKKLLQENGGFEDSLSCLTIFFLINQNLI